VAGSGLNIGRPGMRGASLGDHRNITGRCTALRPHRYAPAKPSKSSSGFTHSAWNGQSPFEEDTAGPNRSSAIAAQGPPRARERAANVVDAAVIGCQCLPTPPAGRPSNGVALASLRRRPVWHSVQRLGAPEADDIVRVPERAGGSILGDAILAKRTLSSRQPPTRMEAVWTTGLLVRPRRAARSPTGHGDLEGRSGAGAAHRLRVSRGAIGYSSRRVQPWAKSPWRRPRPGIGKSVGCGRHFAHCKVGVVR
jgi:hypothetical protein